MKLAVILFIAVVAISGCTATQTPDSDMHTHDDGTTHTHNETPEAPDPIPEPDPISTPEVKSFTITADEFTYDPNPITVNKGDLVRITFEWNDEAIYFGGLDLKSDYFTIMHKVGGPPQTVEFTANETFEYIGYWPSTSQRKATGTVTVE